MAAPPGWYPDPDRTSSGLRWWNGTNWTDFVAPQQHHGTPAPPLTPTAAMTTPTTAPTTTTTTTRKKKRKGRVSRSIRWASLGTFAITVGVIAYALVVNDQKIDTVEGAGVKIRFAGSDGVVNEQQASETSDELRRRVEELEDKARDKAAREPAPTTTRPAEPNGGGGGADAAVEAIDLTGDWESDDGYVHRIDQFGHDIVMQSSDPRYPGFVAAVAQGTVVGNRVTIVFQNADYSTGRAEFRYDRGSDRLEGTYVNESNGARGPLVLERT